MKKKLVSSLLAVSLVTMTFTPSIMAKENDDITIGVSFQGLSDEYIVRLSDAFKTSADVVCVNIQVAAG